MHLLMIALVLIYAPAHIMYFQFGMRKRPSVYVCLWLWMYGTMLMVIITGLLVSLLTWAPSWESWKLYFAGGNKMHAIEWMTNVVKYKMDNVILMGLFVAVALPFTVVYDIFIAAFHINPVVLGGPILYSMYYSLCKTGDVLWEYWKSVDPRLHDDMFK